ncbi:MAG: hypothetical protein A2W91_07805 [Bacteroidetes bacterium GWF2_38_335]|nr:MAG: hypothetical protein A2W91_07805 [Bacteroidetes bacterium GWF2_38_335]OFY79043.1 MAG: hypothetical protein A2281_02915 [Bacteroidetes bacterium RIFOXYA12_FULL_38_20]HBS86124.1 hypothetical protein [Bacteroidales bacterium]
MSFLPNTKQILLPVVFVLLSFSVFSQNKYKERGDEAFSEGEFFKAIELYDEAVKKSTNNPEKAEILFKTAECYRIINNPNKAESFYRKAIMKGYADPVAVLYFADALKINQKYEEAIPEYQKYRTLVPKDPRGETGEKSCELAAKWVELPTRYEILNQKEFNSKQLDFSPSFADQDYKTIYFTSSRQAKPSTKINPISGEYFSDIFMSQFTKKLAWSIPEPLNDTINSDYDEASPTLSSDGTELFFNRCVNKKNETNACQVYQSVRQAGSDWETTQLVEIFGDTISAYHPSLSADGTQLFFSSNKITGQGGYDIWMIERSGKGAPWTKPVNMGKEINTPGNEMFPFIREDGALYFASNTHLGMGGLDIFRAEKQIDGKWKVENMKYPVNSSSDDFGIIFMGRDEKGYFSSSRRITGSKGGDDIYFFELPPLEFSLQGKVKDATTDDPIAGAKIKIFGSDGSDIEISTIEDGTFKYNLQKNTDYVFVVSKDGYLKGKGKASTSDLADSYAFMNDVTLAPLAKSIDLPNIYYDFGDFTLREESKVELDKLVKTLVSNPNITIEIGSHTDMVGSDADNLVLSQKRAQSVVEYLISKGIEKERLTAKGYGESVPKAITKKIAAGSIFEEGVVLTPEFIKGLDNDEEKEAANQINRRTDFRVLRTDYISKMF